MKNGEVTSDDVIFYEDMFTPGLECLPYIMQQSPAEYRPKVFLRFLAQSVDPDDFIVREGMFDWMRKYEEMVDQFVDGIMVASEEFVAHLRIAGIKCPIYVTGLPFGKSEVQERVSNQIPIVDRANRVAYSSRWDDEKQPHFYMDLAEEYYKVDPTMEFSIFCGHPELKSNKQEYVDRAMFLQDSNTANFKVYTGLKKNDYYSLLADSKILFNCALQALEKLGRMVLSIDNLDTSMYNIGKISDYQNGTIDRTLDSILTEDANLRDRTSFRKYVAKAKYE